MWRFRAWERAGLDSTVSRPFFSPTSTRPFFYSQKLPINRRAAKWSRVGFSRIETSRSSVEQGRAGWNRVG
eukprot:4430473-Pyramimonas_sp.AAC.1